MKTYQPIRRKFLDLNVTTREWLPHSGFPKTAETVNAIIHRDAPADPQTVIFMAFCLGFASTEILDLLGLYLKERPDKAKEVAIFRKLIAPINISADEQDVITRLRRLTDQKRKLVTDLLDNLGV